MTAEYWIPAFAGMTPQSWWLQRVAISPESALAETCACLTPGAAPTASNQIGRAAISAARPSGRRPARALRLQRGEIGRRVQYVILTELADHRSHQRRPGAGPIAVLHVVELPPEIARRAARERRHRA